MNYTEIDWNQAVQDTLATHEKEKAGSNKSASNEVDLTKYFTLALPDGVNSGEKVFRCLPLTNEDLRKFHTMAKFHSLKVGKRYVKLYDPAQDGEESPLSDMNKLLLNTGSNDTERAENKKLAGNYKSRDFYIMKGIERGKEHEGVKFWRFNRVYDGSGIMDKLDPLMKRLNDKKPGSGAIWRPDAEGRDIVITLVRDTSKGFTKVSQIMVDDPSPLSTDEAQVTAWLNDPITWKDIYKKKPVEYLRIIAEGSEPVWDKEAKKFVAKADDSYGATSAPATPPNQANYSAPPADASEEADAKPVAIDDLPF